MSAELPTVGELVDPFYRRVSYLRVSLSDRCNFRCTYCMPAEGVALLPREGILSFEELNRIVTVFAGLGVRRVRLTGGEPTIRHSVARCVAMLSRIAGIDAVVMTTNGHRLPELAAPLARAGLSGLNVSLDTLDAEKFASVTRRGDLSRVLLGIDVARAAGLPVKINVVALKGWNDFEFGALCDYAWERGVTPRFIEWMPMSGGGLYAPGAHLTAAEIRALITAHTGRGLVPKAAPLAHVGPARYYAVDERREVGIIAALSEHFCATCNRVRLDAVGLFHTCLAYDDATDLRKILRDGGTDEDLVFAIQRSLARKRASHALDCRGGGSPAKHMVSIGG